MLAGQSAFVALASCVGDAKHQEALKCDTLQVHPFSNARLGGTLELEGFLSPLLKESILRGGRARCFVRVKALSAFCMKALGRCPVPPKTLR